MKENYKKFLLNHPVLKRIGEKGIDEISSIASFIHLKKGEFLFKEGSEGEDLYILIEGEVEILKGEENIRIAELKKGAIIGEISFLLKSGRTGTVRAKDDSVFFRIDGRLLEEKILKGEKPYIELLFSLSKILAERLKIMNNNAFELLKKESLDKDELNQLKENFTEGFVF